MGHENTDAYPALTGGTRHKPHHKEGYLEKKSDEEKRPFREIAEQLIADTLTHTHFTTQEMMERAIELAVKAKCAALEDWMEERLDQISRLPGTDFESGIGRGYELVLEHLKQDTKAEIAARMKKGEYK